MCVHRKEDGKDYDGKEGGDGMTVSSSDRKNGDYSSVTSWAYTGAVN